MPGDAEAERGEGAGAEEAGQAAVGVAARLEAAAEEDEGEGGDAEGVGPGAREEEKRVASSAAECVGEGRRGGGGWAVEGREADTTRQELVVEAAAVPPFRSQEGAARTSASRDPHSPAAETASRPSPPCCTRTAHPRPHTSQRRTPSL